MQQQQVRGFVEKLQTHNTYNHRISDALVQKMMDWIYNPSISTPQQRMKFLENMWALCPFFYPNYTSSSQIVEQGNTEPYFRVITLDYDRPGGVKIVVRHGRRIRRIFYNVIGATTLRRRDTSDKFSIRSLLEPQNVATQQQQQKALCPICLEPLTDNLDTLPCGHVFHNQCISMVPPEKNGKIKCPLCRKQTSLENKAPNVPTTGMRKYTRRRQTSSSIPTRTSYRLPQTTLRSRSSQITPKAPEPRSQIVQQTYKRLKQLDNRWYDDKTTRMFRIGMPDQKLQQIKPAIRSLHPTISPLYMGYSYVQIPYPTQQF